MGDCPGRSAEWEYFRDLTASHGIAANLWYRWKDEAEQGAKAALGGRSAAGGVEAKSKQKRVKQLERMLGRKQLEIEILKNVLGE